MVIHNHNHRSRPPVPAPSPAGTGDPVDSGTRERILAVAETTFAEAGYHGARLHEIARRAGLRKASLFHHFASKDDLYRAVVERGALDTEQGLRLVLEGEGEPQAKIEALLSTYVDMVAEHPDRTRILLRQSLDGSPAIGPSPATRQLLQSLLDFIAAGQRLKIFLPIDAETLVLGLIGTVAFLFTSAAALVTEGPRAFEPASVERIKRHVTEVARRCLIGVHAEAEAGGSA